MVYDWDWPTAERELKRAIGLNPSYAVAHHWYAEYLIAMGRHSQAIAEIRRAQELDPNFGVAHLNLAFAYLGKEMYEEAMAEFEESDRLIGRNPTLHRAFVFAAAGKRSEAVKSLDRLWQQYKRGKISQWELASLYAVLGEEGRALDLLQEAYEQRNPVMPILRQVPEFDPLHSDARFQDILRRMNFPP